MLTPSSGHAIVNLAVGELHFDEEFVHVIVEGDVLQPFHPHWYMLQNVHNTSHNVTRAFKLTSLKRKL